MSSSNWVTSLLSSGSPAALVCRWAENSTANSSATENEQLATTLHLILTPPIFCSPVKRLPGDLGVHNYNGAQGHQFLTCARHCPNGGIHQHGGTTRKE